MSKEEFNLKNEYEQLRKNYKELPNFEDLNNDFELDAIDKPGFLHRQIRRRLNDKVIFFCKIVENLIYPSMQSTIGAYESNFFNDTERDQLVKLHKTLMVYERRALGLDVETGEEGDIQFILDLVKEFGNFKLELIKVVSKMTDTWKKELEDDGERYFG